MTSGHEQIVPLDSPKKFHIANFLNISQVSVLEHCHQVAFDGTERVARTDNFVS